MERQQPLTADTLLRIYSLTKPLTSIAFMMLVEEGVVAPPANPLRRQLRTLFYSAVAG